MNRIKTFGAALILAFSPLITSASPWVGFDIAETRQTCIHYDNRARFRDLKSGLAFEAMLADSCKTALDQLVGFSVDSPYKAKRARTYLERLTDFRKTISEMNLQVFELSRQTTRTRKSTSPFETRQGHRMVNRTGEYLIARQMGVLNAYRDWIDATGVEMAVLPGAPVQ